MVFQRFLQNMGRYNTFFPIKKFPIGHTWDPDLFYSVIEGLKDEIECHGWIRIADINDKLIVYALYNKRILESKNYKSSKSCFHYNWSEIGIKIIYNCKYSN